MIINVIFLVSALFLDTLAASIAYGACGMRLSGRQIAAINGIGSGCLLAALLLGSLIDHWIPETFTRQICFFSLFFLGLMKLGDSALKSYLRENRNFSRDIGFSVCSLKFVIRIYSDPVTADLNQDRKLSWKETVFFALAMSIDGMVAGTMAAFLKVPVVLTVLTAFVMGECFTYFGLFLGRTLEHRKDRDFTFLGGILFLVLAFLKLWR